MLSFPVSLVPGKAIYQQIVHAVKRALVTGHLQAGARFPAIRAISAELQVNPNTVQKAFTELISNGILEVRPGQGCFVASKAPVMDRRTRLKELEPAVEKLLVDAFQRGLDEEEIILLVLNLSRKLKRS